MKNRADSLAHERLEKNNDYALFDHVMFENEIYKSTVCNELRKPSFEDAVKCVEEMYNGCVNKVFLNGQNMLENNARVFVSRELLAKLKGLK